jgi:ubiquinone/menaquinone biosynthesis C-methylase UbiE
VTEEALRRRSSEIAARFAARADERAQELAERVRQFVRPRGDERAVDVGAGTGALAFALAPIVREVVAVELVPEMIEEGRRRAGAHPTVTFIEGDATRLPFESESVDLAGTRNVLHHVPRPELAFAELTRVTRRGGHLLVISSSTGSNERASRPTHGFFPTPTSGSSSRPTT